MSKHTLLHDITLLSATFNRHDATLGMLKSFYSASRYFMPAVIIDNSTTTPLPFDGSPEIRVIDNRNFRHTKNYGQPSKNHCSSIQYALSLMLCDNDILFTPNISTLLELYNKYDAIGEITWDVVPPDRLLPYLCIFDLERMKHDHISYFHESRCINNTNGTPYMDTGASFYMDIVKANWNIYKCSIADFCSHIKGYTLHNASNYLNVYRNHIMRYSLSHNFEG